LASSVIHMADDQDAPNYAGEDGNAPEISDYDDSTSGTATAAAAVVNDDSTPLPSDDYDDGPIEDYVVKLVVNEQPDGAILDAAVTDMSGNIISSNTKIYDTINGYTTALYDELNGNTTSITGGKRLWGWSTKKLIFAALIALCLLGIILAIVFIVLGKYKKNKRSTPAGTTTTTKTVVTKGVSPDQKYQPVPNV